MPSDSKISSHYKHRAHSTEQIVSMSMSRCADYGILVDKVAQYGEVETRLSKSPQSSRTSEQKGRRDDNDEVNGIANRNGHELRIPNGDYLQYALAYKAAGGRFKPEELTAPPPPREAATDSRGLASKDTTWAGLDRHP
jgi:hypothetical protein